MNAFTARSAGAAGALLTGHGGISPRGRAQNRGRRDPTATKDAAALARKSGRTAAAFALREWRRGNRPDPWTPEAVARRKAAAEQLAAAMRLWALEERAQTVERCGIARVAFAWLPVRWGVDVEDVGVVDGGVVERVEDPETGEIGVRIGKWVCGAHGLAVAVVDECGHRLCPMCAARASRRNRRRIVERVEALDGVARQARDGDHARRFHGPLDEADNAVDVLSRSFADAPESFYWRQDVAVDDGDGLVDLLNRWRFRLLPGWETGRVVDAVEAAAARRSPEGLAFQSEAFRIADARRDRLGFYTDLVDEWTGDRVFTPVPFGATSSPGPGHPLSKEIARRDRLSMDARFYVGGAKRAQKKAMANLAAAIAKEEAARALDAVEHPRRRRVVDDAVAAGEALVDAVAAAEPVYGPVEWRTRDRLRFATQARRAAVVVVGDCMGYEVERSTGDALRALRAIHRQDDEARARLQRRHAAHLEAAAVVAMRRARRETLRFERERAAARWAAAEAKLWRSVDVRFLTLTQQDNFAESAKEALARLMATLQRFLRSKEWRRRVAGSIVHIEIERSTPESRRAKARKALDEAAVLRAAGLDDEAKVKEDSGHNLLRREKETSKKAPAARSWWHAHAHIACSSGFWPVDEINDAWSRSAMKAKGTTWAPSRVDDDGVGVDLVVGARSRPRVKADMRRPSRGVRGVVDELTKYITKPVGIGRLSVDETAQLLDAVNGRRLLRCTGALRGVALVEQSKEAQVKEGHAGDGIDTAIGYVEDETQQLGGVRGVWLSHTDRHGRERTVDGGVDPAFADVVAVYRDDADAQEFYRLAHSRAFRAHEAKKQANRAAATRAVPDDVVDVIVGDAVDDVAFGIHLDETRAP